MHYILQNDLNDGHDVHDEIKHITAQGNVANHDQQLSHDIVITDHHALSNGLSNFDQSVNKKRCVPSSHEKKFNDPKNGQTQAQMPTASTTFQRQHTPFIHT